MTRLVYLPDVVTLKLDSEKCNGCGMCVKVCPHAVFEMVEKKAEIIGFDYCMECGACAMNCTENAITVKTGVGCAAAIISGAIRHSDPVCGCSGDAPGCN